MKTYVNTHIQTLFIVLFCISIFSGTAFYLIEHAGLSSFVFTVPFVLEWFSIIQFVHKAAGISITLGFIFYFIRYIRNGTGDSVLRKIVYFIIGIDLILLTVTGLGRIILFSHIQILQTLHTNALLILIFLLTLSFLLSIYESKKKLLDIFLPVCYSRPNSTLLFTVLLVAVALIWMLGTVSGLHLRSVQKKTHVSIDGFDSSGEWADIEGVECKVYSGANFTEGSIAKIKSQHDHQYIYFIIQWEDPNRSFNRFVIKEKDIWNIQKTEPEPTLGETVYYEDQLAIFFSKDKSSCFNTCHYDSEMKKTIHFTNDSPMDVWFWKALSTNPLSLVDDGWVGVKNDSTLTGFIYDNKGGGGMISNLNKDWQQPYFVPLFSYQRYWINLKHDNVLPYFAEIDSLNEGFFVPEVIIAPMTGDRADVRARGNWSNGSWTLELARVLKTGSPHDIPLHENAYFSIALFNNASLDHTLLFESIYLTVE